MECNVEKRYQSGLEKEKENNQSEDAVENILKFYRKNKAICDLAYKYYNDYYKNVNKYVMSPVVKQADEFRKILRPLKILVLTATSIERGVLLRWLSEKKGAPLETYLVDSVAYNIYQQSDTQCLIHVNQQKTGEEFTRKIINMAYNVFKPDYICMVGICYGLDRKKDFIGSVFISDCIKSFRINFRDEAYSDEVKFEAEDEYEKQPSDKMIQAINSKMLYTTTYNILSNPDKPINAVTKIGRFLSSNSLMSSCKVKRAVLESYGNVKPVPLGGEMEGAGILKSYMVENDLFSQWVMIKSVCDWGEKKNMLDKNEKKSEKIKDSLQAFAMANSCGVFEELLDVLK